MSKPNMRPGFAEPGEDEKDKEVRKAKQMANFYERKYRRLLTISAKELEAEKKYEMIKRLNIRARYAEEKARRLERKVLELENQLKGYA